MNYSTLDFDGHEEFHQYIQHSSDSLGILAPYAISSRTQSTGAS